ncbi:hypothetical protein [Gilvimarinus xylanilyticus]|uniref:Uncharacterized protein n=1 Tax=Gilvimarinus xylanilyticus TaxID=2944139 RepID=A0A9X2KX27_9GAMM|nr:hypothetical protein [Gilvimarinus xylanilyticus]MCP8900450.1 hypothetical protein [Gilvimarinus xylanilyticus]
MRTIKVLMVFLAVATGVGLSTFLKPLKTPDAQRPAKPSTTSPFSQRIELTNKNSIVEKQKSPLPKKESTPKNLKDAIHLGMNYDELIEADPSITEQHLHQLFTRNTHINLQWLHDNGFPESTIQSLFNLWSSGNAKALQRKDVKPLVVSRYNTHQSNGIYKAQTQFSQFDRRLNVYFPLPDNYSADSVIIHWRHSDGSTLSHFDRHPLQSDGQYHNAWLRLPGGWESGEYDVAVYAADSQLTPLAANRFAISSPSN